MTKLPITISAEQHVSENFDLSKSVLEKMEAWANFETLKANWYQDEINFFKCQFTLVSAQTFQDKFANLQQEDWQINNVEKTAIKSGDISVKHHVILTIDESIQQPSDKAGTWIGSDIQANLQGIIRQHLLAFAKQHNLDPID